MYAYGPQQRYWTFEYALSYLFAPAMGGFMAGNIFNQIKNSIDKIEGNYTPRGSTITDTDRETTKKETYDENTYREGTFQQDF